MARDCTNPPMSMSARDRGPGGDRGDDRGGDRGGGDRGGGDRMRREDDRRPREDEFGRRIRDEDDRREEPPRRDRPR